MILACTRPLSAAACGNRSEPEQNHGYENEWEETHNEQEDQCTQDHPPRECRTVGSEEDQRQEEGSGAEDCCP